ncbi:MAG: hypothetical protein QM774_03440 [Gordonia sp. (in: high G+C Gram-positive bacteria)]|uniref:hypothetical protein n=1 Tax=Gordonia sp. (in: high G+C Gram-positive bacteria) TaxID=84139 RepID=UPI0039E3E8E1
MLTQVAVIPGAPLLVPELAGPEAYDTDDVRASVLAAGRSLAAASRHWIALGVGDPGTITGVATSGDFGRFGVPLPVRLPGPDAAGGRMPASMLIAAWLAGQVSPAPDRVDPVVVDPDLDPADCLALGRRTAQNLPVGEPIGLLVVADGANALHPKAPGGGERESAWVLQRTVDQAVASGDPAGLAGLSVDACRADGVTSRAAWQVLAGILEVCPMTRVDVHYAAAPFGVGYTVVTLRGRS